MMETTETEKEVINVLQNRWKIGREKYGKGISYKQLPTMDKWLDEAIEECADMLQYLVAMKLKIKHGK